MAKIEPGTYRLDATGKTTGQLRRPFRFATLKVLVVVVVVLPTLVPETSPAPPETSSPSLRPTISYTESATIDAPVDRAIVDAQSITVSGTLSSDNPDRKSLDVLVNDERQIATLQGSSFSAQFDDLSPGVKSLSTELDANGSRKKQFLVPRLKIDFETSSRDWKLVAESGFPNSAIPFELANEPRKKDQTNFLAGTAKPKPTDVILLADKSVSMTRTLALPRLRNEIGLNLLKEFESKLGTETRFKLILFSDSDRGTLTLKELPSQSPTRFIDSPETIHELFDSFFAEGGNYTSSGSKAELIHEALWSVMSQCKSIDPNDRRQKIIVLVTDSYSLNETRSLETIAEQSKQLGIPCFTVFMHYLKRRNLNRDDSKHFRWNWTDGNVASSPSFDLTKFEKTNEDPLRGKAGENWDKGTQLGIFESKKIAKLTGGFFYRHAEQAFIRDDDEYLDTTAKLISATVGDGIGRWKQRQQTCSWLAPASSVRKIQNASGEVLEFSLLNCDSASLRLISDSTVISLKLEPHSGWKRHRVKLDASEAWQTSCGKKANDQKIAEVLQNLVELKIQILPHDTANPIGLDNLMLAEEFIDEQSTDESN